MRLGDVVREVGLKYQAAAQAVKRFAAEGVAGIAIADVNREGLEETAGMLSDAKVSQHIVDVSDRTAMQGFVEDVIREHGRVTHVINNAGVALGGTLKEVSLEEIEWLMGVNFWGVVHGTMAFLPYLRIEMVYHALRKIYCKDLGPGLCQCTSPRRIGFDGGKERLRRRLDAEQRRLEHGAQPPAAQVPFGPLGRTSASARPRHNRRRAA